MLGAQTAMGRPMFCKPLQSVEKFNPLPPLVNQDMLQVYYYHFTIKVEKSKRTNGTSGSSLNIEA
jgi:hypothetical protein